MAQGTSYNLGALNPEWAPVIQGAKNAFYSPGNSADVAARLAQNRAGLDLNPPAIAAAPVPPAAPAPVVLPGIKTPTAPVQAPAGAPTMAQASGAGDSRGSTVAGAPTVAGAQHPGIDAISASAAGAALQGQYAADQRAAYLATMDQIAKSGHPDNASYRRAHEAGAVAGFSGPNRMASDVSQGAAADNATAQRGRASEMANETERVSISQRDKAAKLHAKTLRDQIIPTQIGSQEGEPGMPPTPRYGFLQQAEDGSIQAYNVAGQKVDAQGNPPPTYQEGRTYTDAKGNKAIYQNGGWTPAQ